jgi:hypothetical protein
MRLYLQTMVRKSELQDATWDEIDFENAVWTISKVADEALEGAKRLSVAPGPRSVSRRMRRWATGIAATTTSLWLRIYGRADVLSQKARGIFSLRAGRGPTGGFRARMLIVLSRT